MGWNYVFLLNLFSAAGLSIIWLTQDYLPWYLKAILGLNLLVLAISSIMNDDKDKQRDEKIKQLEKEMQELKQEQNKENENEKNGEN